MNRLIIFSTIVIMTFFATAAFTGAYAAEVNSSLDITKSDGDTLDYKGNDTYDTDTLDVKVKIRPQTGAAAVRPQADSANKPQQATRTVSRIRVNNSTWAYGSGNFDINLADLGVGAGKNKDVFVPLEIYYSDGSKKQTNLKILYRPEVTNPSPSPSPSPLVSPSPSPKPSPSPSPSPKASPSPSPVPSVCQEKLEFVRYECTTCGKGKKVEKNSCTGKEQVSNQETATDECKKVVLCAQENKKVEEEKKKAEEDGKKVQKVLINNKAWAYGSSDFDIDLKELGISEGEGKSVKIPFEVFYVNGKSKKTELTIDYRPNCGWTKSQNQCISCRKANEMEINTCNNQTRVSKNNATDDNCAGETWCPQVTTPSTVPATSNTNCDARKYKGLVKPAGTACRSGKDGYVKMDYQCRDGFIGEILNTELGQDASKCLKQDAYKSLAQQKCEARVCN